MKKWIIGLSVIGSLTTVDAVSQVYNQKFEKRYSNEIESAEAYQKHIQKLERRLFTDYSNFLKELNFSRAYSRIELMRQDRLKRLNEIRFDLNSKIDYDRQFNDSRHSITKDFNILLDHYSSLYSNEYKENIEIQTNVVDSLHEYKAYHAVLMPLVKKSSEARNTFNTKFSAFEKEYDLAPEDPDKIESYSRIQKELFELEDRIKINEDLSLYYSHIGVKLMTLETIDGDFRLAAGDLDSNEMANTIRYQRNHSAEAFKIIQSMDKFNGIENELKNNALRVVKNHMSNSRKVYTAILKFATDNRRVLIQERKNMEEYLAVSVDKSKFKNKKEQSLYIENQPSQKFTEKFRNLILKYREKTDNTIQEYDSSFEELILAYIKKYNPINQKF